MTALRPSIGCGPRQAAAGSGGASQPLPALAAVAPGGRVSPRAAAAPEPLSGGRGECDRRPFPLSQLFPRGAGAALCAAGTVDGRWATNGRLRRARWHRVPRTDPAAGAPAPPRGSRGRAAGAAVTRRPRAWGGRWRRSCCGGAEGRAGARSAVEGQGGGP